LDDFQGESQAQQRVRTQIRQFLSELPLKPPGCLLLGNVGTGKTLLGTALVNHCLDRDGPNSAMFCTLIDLFRRIKDTFDPSSSGTESAVRRRLETVPLLVIDEIGVQFNTPFEQATLTALINQRYNELLSTVLVGNLTVEECEAILGERAMDRFREGGHVLSFTWKSLRGAAQIACN
jgi:DNA replication protein DnaC